MSFEVSNPNSSSSASTMQRAIKKWIHWDFLHFPSWHCYYVGSVYQVNMWDGAGLVIFFMGVYMDTPVIKYIQNPGGFNFWNE